MDANSSDQFNPPYVTVPATDVYYSYAERQILAAITGTTAILGVTGNALIILAVLLSRKLRHTTNYFVLNLSVADLLTSLDLPLIVLSLLRGEWPLPDPICVGSAIVVLTCLTVSINCLTCVALNRCILITKPITVYRKIFTSRRTAIAIAFSWLFPLSVLLTAAGTGFIKLGFDPEFFVCTWIISQSNPGYYLVFFFTAMVAQFSAILWSYVCVFRHVRKHARAVGHMEDGPTASVAPQASRRIETDGPTASNAAPAARRERRHQNKLQIDVTKNLFFVVCVFTLCISPFGLSLVLQQHGRRLYPVGATILACNSCVNPIIYAAKHPQFRSVFKAILLCRFSEIPERVRFC